MNPTEKPAADGLFPAGQADSAAAAADGPSNRVRYGAAPAVLSAVLLLCALAAVLWFAQIRADNRAAAQLCETVSLLLRDELTGCGDPGAFSTADFVEAGSLDIIVLPAALDREAGRKVRIRVDAGGTPYSVTVQVQGGDGVTAAESRFTVWPLTDQTP